MNNRAEMACQQCLTPLNTLGDPPRYLHPLSLDTDGHQPVPVGVAQLHTVARRCDFCGDPHPVWTLTGQPIATVALHGDGGGIVQNLGERWASCATCHHLIDNGKTDALTDRAAAAIGVRGDRQARDQIAHLHTTFLQHRQAGRILITTTAWPATPIQARDLPKIRDRLAHLYNGPDDLPTHRGHPDLRTSAAAGLQQAGLYWVDPDFTDLVEHASGHLPAATINPDDMPATNGLLVWSRPITTRQIIAASWTTTPTGWQLVCYRPIGAGLDPTPMQRLREQIGWLVPMHVTHIDTNALLPEGDPAAPIAATWLLIAQKITETVPAPIDPATAKSYARTKRPTPDVRVVRIRPHARRNPPPAGGGEPGHVYTGRFWVTGHWRNQAYGPARSLRRPVYINPFLKGSDDLPIQQASTVRVLGTTRTNRNNNT